MQLDLALLVADASAEAGVEAEVAADRSAARTHGGRREGAGRKKNPHRRDPLHRTRPDFAKRFPQHVVLRTRAEVGRLRRGKIYRALRAALRRQLGKLGFQVVHLSIQRNHLHFIVEAAGKNGLRRGMQGLAISAAKAINRTLKRKGKVFEFRYHATAIRTPRQARNALAYVLNNWRRHNEDERAKAARFAAIDPYSTARQFRGWKELHDAVMPPGFKTFDPLEVAQPSTWLLSTGWLAKHGPISCWATPGPLPTR
jgi:REP element-mobilizing transposase RayT